MEAKYFTLREDFRVEIPKIKGSRFIGYSFGASSPKEFDTALGRIQKEFNDARHHCWAWIDRKGAERFSDDGEPNGSAGRPILKVMHGLKLQSTGVIVIRYFGGTKLGVGGLIRAYTQASQACLPQIHLQPTFATLSAKLIFPYALKPHIDRAIKNFVLTPPKTEFLEKVTYGLTVREHDWNELEKILLEIGGGKLEICPE
ncbi:MAG: YigZ family protein [Myxococcota bacterium]|nr:YigZ family protein [Myxococcota bacterium]